MNRLILALVGSALSVTLVGGLAGVAQADTATDPVIPVVPIVPVVPLVGGSPTTTTTPAPLIDLGTDSANDPLADINICLHLTNSTTDDVALRLRSWLLQPHRPTLESLKARCATEKVVKVVKKRKRVVHHHSTTTSTPSSSTSTSSGSTAGTETTNNGTVLPKGAPDTGGDTPLGGDYAPVMVGVPHAQ